jgi:hypothetical protein
MRAISLFTQKLHHRQKLPLPNGESFPDQMPSPPFRISLKEFGLHFPSPISNFFDTFFHVHL